MWRAWLKIGLGRSGGSADGNGESDAEEFSRINL